MSDSSSRAATVTTQATAKRYKAMRLIGALAGGGGLILLFAGPPAAMPLVWLLLLGGGGLWASGRFLSWWHHA